MPIEYDPTVESLLHPERRETVFLAGTAYNLLQLAVEACRLAYYKAEDRGAQLARLVAALQLAGFAQAEHFSSALGAQAFAAYRPADRLALVAFRGTQADVPEDIGIDVSRPLTRWQGQGKVHAGFAADFESLCQPLQHWLDTVGRGRSSLLLCGHGLGGALACLAASLWQPAQLITIGAPRVGDEPFVATLAGIDNQRIVNCCDLVSAALPEALGYRHPPHYTLVTWDRNLHSNPSDNDVDRDCRAGRADFYASHALRPGNVPSRDLADHSPVNYLRAFFP